MVEALLDVAVLRVRVRAAGLGEVTSAGSNLRFAPVELKESGRLRLARVYPKSLYKEAAKVVLVPAPRAPGIGGKPLRDRELIAWVTSVVDVLDS